MGTETRWLKHVKETVEDHFLLFWCMYASPPILQVPFLQADFSLIPRNNGQTKSKASSGIWDHYTKVTEKTDQKSTWKCNYCVHQIMENSSKMTKHTLSHSEVFGVTTAIGFVTVVHSTGGLTTPAVSFGFTVKILQ